MREIRQSGSEGGETELNRSSLPLSTSRRYTNSVMPGIAVAYWPLASGLTGGSASKLYEEAARTQDQRFRQAGQRENRGISYSLSSR